MKADLKHEVDLLCPSAQPDWDGALAIGIVNGTTDAPRVRTLETPLAVTPELLTLAAPVQPTEVFRFAAPCLKESCKHFQQGTCHLANKIAKLLPRVSDRFAICKVRARCRWFSQEGRAACERCPQVVTDDALASAQMRLISDPDFSID